MIDVGLLNEIYDLFTLKDHKEEILELEGFGKILPKSDQCDQ